MSWVGPSLFTAVFVAALLGKVDSWGEWSITTRSWFDLAWARVAVRRGVPVLEGVVLLALVVRPRLGLALCALTLAVFAAGAAVLLSRGVSGACTCFGAASPSRVGVRLILRNVGLVIAATVIHFLPTPRPDQPLPSLLVALLLAIAFLLHQETAALVLARGSTEKGEHRWTLGTRL